MTSQLSQATLTLNPGPHHFDLLDLRVREEPLHEGRADRSDEGLGSRLIKRPEQSTFTSLVVTLGC